MRKLFLAVLVLHHCCAAQHPLATSWNFTVDFTAGEDASGRRLFEIYNNIFVLTRIHDQPNDAWGSVTYIQDSSGQQMVPTKTFLASNYNALFLSKAVAVGSRVVYGVGYSKKHGDTYNSHDLYFVKYDALGDTVFTKIFNDTGAVVGKDLVCLNPNLFAVLCQARPNNQTTGTARTGIMLLDSLANVISQNFLQPGEYIGEILCHNPQENEFYVLGIRPSPTTPPNGYYSFLMAFDDSTLGLKHTIADLAGKENRVRYAACYHGTLYCAFKTQVWIPPIPFPCYQAEARMFDVANQNVVLKNKFTATPVDTTGFGGPRNMMMDGDKLILTSFNSYTDHDMHFFDTTLNELCRAKVYGPGSTPTRGYISSCVTRSKRIISTGADYNGANSTSWVSRSINYQTYIEEDCGAFVDVAEYNRSVVGKLFPNPFGDYISLEVDFLRDDLSTITVIDIMGRPCITQTLDRSTYTQVDVSALHPGIYNVVVTNKGERWHGKMIKQ